MIRQFATVVTLSLLLVSGVQAATMVSIGDSMSNANISGGAFADEYTLILNTDTDVRIDGIFNNMHTWYGFVDIFFLQSETTTWAGSSGSLDTGFFGLTAGQYDFTVRGEVLPGTAGSYDLTISAVPLPAAFWLFGSALIGFIALSRRHRLR